MSKSSIWKGLGSVLVVGGVVSTILFAGSIIETNQAENYQIKQAAISGDMTIRSSAGMYMQNFGKITTYRLADDVPINKVSVRFRDGSTATITGTVKFRSPVSFEERMTVHKEMQSYNTVKNVLVVSAIEGALKQTSNLFGAEEVYSTKRSEFIEMFRDQLIDGIYKTTTGESTNEITLDVNGERVLAKPSVLTDYGFEIINIEINDISFDKKTDELIAARKDAEQQETLARAEAIRAQQDALTAVQRGKAQVAKAKYDALVIKETAVISAEKHTAVEEQKTLQALEAAKQIEANGAAEAFRQKALVEAGLSPLQRAEIERDTAIGVAQAMSNIKLPAVMTWGSDGAGGGNNPLEAINIKMMMDIAREVSQGGSTGGKH